MGEQALEAFGLGGAAAAASGRGRARSSDRGRSHRDRSSSSDSRYGGRSRHSKPKGKEQILQALKAAATAGAAEAARSRNAPGGWGGEKGKRVLTAAVSAGGFDKLIDRNPDKHGTRHVVQSTLVGLLTNSVVNGSRSKSRSRSRHRGRDDRHSGRGRARSDSRSGLKELGGAAALTAAGKKIYDHVRSKSRGRGSRSPSSSSYDSRSPPRHREKKKKRSSSISALATKGLGALGLSEAADKNSDRGKHRSSTYDDYDDRHHRSSRGGGAPPPYAGSGYGDPRDVGQPRSNGANGAMVYEAPPHHEHGSSLRTGPTETSSDSDYGSSTDDERKMKKARVSQYLSAGLASVATIHAAHEVYQSMEKRDERHKALDDGDITPAQARRERNKARMKDAAAISIAALGVKGAMSEWKEAKEKVEEKNELKEKALERKEKREARRLRMQQMGVDERYSGSAPTLSTLDSSRFPPPTGPSYHSGNPYETSQVPGPGYTAYAPTPPPQSFASPSSQPYMASPPPPMVNTHIPPGNYPHPASAAATFPPQHYPPPSGL